MGSAKLTNAKVLEIVERCRSGEARASVAESFGIGEGAVGKIMTGFTWGHVTGIKYTPGDRRKRADVDA